MDHIHPYFFLYITQTYICNMQRFERLNNDDFLRCKNCDIFLFLTQNIDCGRRDVPVGVPLDLSTMEWHELPKYNGIQVSQLI